MIALGIRYLTKYAVATNLSRQRPEWPPHPGRIFMAMAAAHFETGADPAERAALQWIESLPPPAMKASEAFERSEVRAYVPVNDSHGGIVARPRQDRAFPRVRPHDDSVFLIWNSESDGNIRSALDKVCRKVTRIGHSSSAVQMWVVPSGREPEPNLLPSPDIADERMRIPSIGTVQSLIEAFNGEAIQEYDRLSDNLVSAKGKEKTRLKNELQSKFGGHRPESRRPTVTHWQGYYRPTPELQEETVDGPFDPNFIVLTKQDGPALGLESTLALTATLRNAAMTAAGVNPPEWLTGHDEAGQPSRLVHAAFFPLPYVGAEFADGHILGLGLALPKTLHSDSATDREESLRRVLGPLFFDPATGEEREIRLWTKQWRWELQRETRERPPFALRRKSWTEPSRTWASATPVVLHHHPKKNREGDVERVIFEAFLSAGLPEPEAVRVRSVSRLEGAGHAMSVPPFSEGDASLCRYQTHVVVRFPKLVRGPVLVGRGRFRGYGLFRSLPEEETR